MVKMVPYTKQYYDSAVEYFLVLFPDFARWKVLLMEM